MKIAQNHLWLVAFALALFISLRVTSQFTSIGQVDATPGEVEPDQTVAMSYAYYRVGNEQPLQIRLEPTDEMIKLVTILEWPREMMAYIMENRVAYALEVQLLDHQKRLVWQDRMWIQSHKTRTFPQGAKVPLEPAFYVGGNKTLLDPRLLTIPVTKLASNARWLALRLAEPAASFAVVRGYRLSHEPVADPLAEWNQLPFAEREERSRGNIFDPSLLSDEECRRLVLQSWRIVLPDGDAGVDFWPVTIYRSPSKLFDETLEPQPVLTHLALSPVRDLSFNFEGPCRVRLVVRAEPEAKAGGRVQLETEWMDLTGPPRTRLYPALVQEREDQVDTWMLPEGPASLVLRSREGHCLVQVEKWFPLMVSQAVGDSKGDPGKKPDKPEEKGAWTPIMPDIVAAYWYLCGETEALHKLGFTGEDEAVFAQAAKDLSYFRFKLPSTAEDARTHYRIQARGVYASGVGPSSPLEVNVDMLDAAGAVLATRRLSAESPRDSGSWLSDKEGACGVGACATFHLELPGRVQILRLQAKNPCLVSVASRTKSIPYEVDVPEDYRAGQATRLKRKIETAKSWFGVRPANGPEAYAAGRVLVLRSGRADVALREEKDEEFKGETSAAPAVAHAGQAMVLWPSYYTEPLRSPLDWTPNAYVRLPEEKPMKAKLPLLFRMEPDEPFPLRLLMRSGMERIDTDAKGVRTTLGLLFPDKGRDAASLDLSGRETHIALSKGLEAFANVLPANEEASKALWKLFSSYRATASKPAVFVLNKHSQGPAFMTLAVCATGSDEPALSSSSTPVTTPSVPVPPSAEVIDLDTMEAEGGAGKTRGVSVEAKGNWKYRVELDVIPLMHERDASQITSMDAFSYRKRIYHIQETGLPGEKPFLLGPHIERVGEAVRVFASLWDDLPAGCYLIRARPMGKYALWTRLTARSDTQTILPPGREIVWHLRGPDLLRLRWRPVASGKRSVLVPLQVRAITPTGAPPLQSALDPSVREEGWIGKQYYLPEGLMSLFVSNPARREDEPGIPVEVAVLRHNGSAPMADSVRVAEVDPGAPQIPIEDEVRTDVRWRLASTGQPLRFSTALSWPVEDQRIAGLFRFDFRALMNDAPTGAEAPAPILRARLLDVNSRELKVSRFPLLLEPDPQAWLEGSSRTLSTSSSLDLNISLQTKFVELSLDSEGADLDLLVWAGRRWREVPPMHFVRQSSVRLAPVSFRAPFRFFPEWQSVEPVLPEGKALPDAKAFSVIHWCYSVFQMVPPADWQRLADTEGQLLPLAPSAGSIAFLEPSFQKVGDPLPWSPTTYAELVQGLIHAISVFPDPRSPEGALVDLDLRYLLPDRFDAKYAVEVWLNEKKVASILPRTSMGMVQLRDVKPGKHLIRVATGQKDARVFINAMPTEFLNAVRSKARDGAVVLDSGEIGIQVERTGTEPQTVHIPIYLAQKQPEAFSKLKSILVEVKLDGAPPPAPVGVLRNSSTRLIRRFVVPLTDPTAEYFSTGGGVQYRSAGMLFFPLEDDLPPCTYLLRVAFPPGLKVLARAFIRVEKELLKNASFRMVYEPFSED